MPALPFLSGDIAGKYLAVSTVCIMPIHGNWRYLCCCQGCLAAKKILHSRLAARNRNFARTQTIF